MNNKNDHPDPKRDQRQSEIETAAYALLSEKGGKATSMLAVAKRAKASNQTMYKWYGDKTGLFLSMVHRNAEAAAKMLQEALSGVTALDPLLDRLGPALLGLVLSEKAVALNRAAAASAHNDPTLGQAIASGGREKIAALLSQVIEKEHPKADAARAANLYLDLVIGDAQIRRVIGVANLPTPQEIDTRAQNAKEILLVWLAAQV